MLKKKNYFIIAYAFQLFQVKLICNFFFLQVINAALALSVRPKSQVLKNNMDMYKSTWENHIHVFTEAVDDITSIDDFLAVSGMLILKI